MSTRPLTPRQREVLDHLAAQLLVLHRLPTVRELACWLGATSTNAAAEYFKHLRDRGYVERVGDGPRPTFRLVHLSDGRPAELAYVDPTTHPTTEERDR